MLSQYAGRECPGLPCYEQRQSDYETCATTGRLGNRNRSVVCLDQTTRDGESETRAAGAAVARFLQAHEGLEDLLPLRGRDAGTLVIHVQGDKLRVRINREVGFDAIDERVVDQVGNDSTQRQAIPQYCRTRCDGYEIYRLARGATVVHLSPDNLREVDQLFSQLTGARTTGQQRVIEELNHVCYIRYRPVPLAFIRNALDTQSQASQERSDIMGDPADHCDTPTNEERHAYLQPVERNLALQGEKGNQSEHSASQSRHKPNGHAQEIGDRITQSIDYQRIAGSKLDTELEVNRRNEGESEAARAGVTPQGNAVWSAAQGGEILIDGPGCDPRNAL